MPGITLLRHADRPARPWKNGGGVMWDIAVSPEGADMNVFDWRVSLARIDDSRPFSMFPGIDRHFAVLEGAGVRLAITGQTETLIKPDHHSLTFSGDLDVAATLEKDAVLALNVMTRRGRYVAALNHAQIETPTTLAFPSEPTGQRQTCLLVLAEGKARYCSLGDTIVDAKDALLWDGSVPITIRPIGMARLWWISIDVASSGISPHSA